MESVQPNLFEQIKTYADIQPGKKALIFTRKNFLRNSYDHITYQQLESQSNQFASGFRSIGVLEGYRILVMIPPNQHFLVVTLALLKLKAIPIFIDPGMGIKSMLKCIKEVKPEGIVGITRAHLLRVLFPSYFTNLKISVSTRRLFFGNSVYLSHLPSDIVNFDHQNQPLQNETFVIAFTSGSTGVPKGVVYTYGNLQAQIGAIGKDLFLSKEDVVMQGFAPFILRDVAMGTTCIFPDMNPSKPSKVNAKSAVDLITKHQVTFSFGSPAFWKRIIKHCLKNELKLKSLRQVMIAGAPVSGELIRNLQLILVNAEIFTPYGSTEALPLSCISGTEILEDTFKKTEEGKGICIGKVLSGVAVKIIKISDGVIDHLKKDLELQTPEIGEIIVEGEMISREYFNNPEQTKLNKICDGNKVWHRMGDLGYFDHEKRLWYCGRKSHRVENHNKIYRTINCESIFNRHSIVSRSALVGFGENGNEVPVMVIEPIEGQFPRNKEERAEFAKSLLVIANAYEQTADITDILFKRRLPVDYRHNAKILRDTLRPWVKKHMT